MLRKLETRLSKIEKKLGGEKEEQERRLAAALEALCVHSGFPPGGCEALRRLNQGRFPPKVEGTFLPTPEEREWLLIGYDEEEANLCHACQERCEHGRDNLARAASLGFKPTDSSKPRAEKPNPPRSNGDPENSATATVATKKDMPVELPHLEENPGSFPEADTFVEELFSEAPPGPRQHSHDEEERRRLFERQAVEAHNRALDAEDVG